MASNDYQWLDLMRAMRAAGFQYNRGLIVGFAVSAGENSTRDLIATFTNTDGSVDRGPWQFNSKFHAEVVDSCAFDLACSCKEAYRVSNQGQSYSAWSAFNNGRYKQFVDLGYAVYALDEAYKQRDSYKAMLDTEKAKSADLQKKLDAANSLVTTLQSQITSIQTSLDAANKQISDMQERAASDAELILQLKDALATESFLRQAVESSLADLRAETQAAFDLLNTDPSIQARDRLKEVL